MGGPDHRRDALGARRRHRDHTDPRPGCHAMVRANCVHLASRPVIARHRGGANDARPRAGAGLTQYTPGLPPGCPYRRKQPVTVIMGFPPLTVAAGYQPASLLPGRILATSLPETPVAVVAGTGAVISRGIAPIAGPPANQPMAMIHDPERFGRASLGRGRMLTFLQTAVLASERNLNRGCAREVQPFRIPDHRDWLISRPDRSAAGDHP